MTIARITFISLVLVAVVSAAAAAQDTPATAKLRSRNSEFREEVIRVAEGVYTAVGYTAATCSMIVGTDGVVIVDTGLAVPHAQRILAEFRKITDKPVRAIVYTHGHADHTGGTSVFAAGGTPEIWARDNYGSETRAWTSIGLRSPQPVGADGMALPPELRINNGVAPALPVPRAAGRPMASLGPETIPPNRTFGGARQVLEIAGVRLELVAAPGETADQLYVWLPGPRVLFSGDNFYKAFPNLYPLRGAQRSAQDWALSVDRMLAEGATAIVPGHTRPILGRELVATALADYRDAIRYVFEKTIEGMNLAKTPDELAASIVLPPNLAGKDYLEEFYGAVAFSVRSIYAQSVGWFDGNATNIARLAPLAHAQRLAALAGGEEKLLSEARTALSTGDAQWAAELADALIALRPADPGPKLVKAAALETLASGTFNAPTRNYYLEYAQMLRAQAR